MPDLNEFFNHAQIIHKPELEAIHGIKPCGKCSKDAEEAFWDPSTLTLAWECPEGHKNQIKVE